jgi:hypothetical protein
MDNGWTSQGVKRLREWEAPAWPCEGFPDSDERPNPSGRPLLYIRGTWAWRGLRRAV